MPFVQATNHGAKYMDTIIAADPLRKFMLLQDNAISLRDEIIKNLIVAVAKEFNHTTGTTNILAKQSLEIAKQLSEFPVIAAMYGAGNITVFQIIAEISYVHRFSNKRALVSYAVLDSEPNDSCKKESKSNHVTKKDST